MAKNSVYISWRTGPQPNWAKRPSLATRFAPSLLYCGRPLATIPLALLSNFVDIRSRDYPRYGDLLAPLDEEPDRSGTNPARWFLAPSWRGFVGSLWKLR